MQKKAAQQKPEKRARIKDQDQTGMQRMIRQYLIKNIAAQKTWGWHDCRPGQQLRFLAGDQPFSSAWTDTAVPIGKPHKNPARRQKLHAGDKCRHFCIMGSVRQLMPDSALTDMISCRISAKGKRTGNT